MQDPVFVKDAFAKIARRYIVTNHVLSLGTDILWRRKTAKLVAAMKPAEALDLATGTGDLAEAVIKAVPTVKMTGADFSAPMLEIAKKRNLPQAEWLVADAMALPFANDRYDVITVGFGLRNMADWPGAIREMSRVLRPGGHLVILDFSLPSVLGLRGAYRFYLHKVLPRLAGLLTGQREAYEYLSGTIERFPSGSAMTCLLCANGFATARGIPLSGGIASLYVAQKPEGTALPG
jgi:demethylmenaquinone methyltransferase/2-methoxy-6-polyprenyl-1,4-benzoquinol methylase